MKMKMMCAAFALSVLGGSLPNVAGAQQAATLHPSYIRAIQDLQQARHYLNDDWNYAPVKADEEAAVREIDAAIEQIKSAAIDKGQNLRDTSRIDIRIPPHDRYRRAQELLNKAHEDMASEDVPSERDLQHRIQGHVDRARDIVNRTESTAKWQ